MTFKEAVEATPNLSGAFQVGLQALTAPEESMKGDAVWIGNHALFTDIRAALMTSEGK